QWDTRGYETFSSAGYEQHLREMAKEDGLIDKNIGSVDSVTISPENLVEAFYETPMVAHDTLEPINCIAQVKGDKVEIWTSTQVSSTITGATDNDVPKQIG